LIGFVKSECFGNYELE